jgi:GntR family transcriptional regulator
MRGELRPGDWIGSEADLAKHYGVSRVTVRQALARLSFDGLIEAFRGKGTFVARPRLSHPVTTIRSFEERMAALGIEVAHRLLAFHPTRPTEKARATLGLASNQQVYRLERLRLIQREIIGLECHFIPETIGRRLDSKRVEDAPVIALIEEATGIQAARWRTTARAERPTRREAKRLGIKPTEPILIREHTLWSADGHPVMCGRNIFISRYEFTMEWVLQHGQLLVKSEMNNSR